MNKFEKDGCNNYKVIDTPYINKSIYTPYLDMKVIDTPYNNLRIIDAPYKNYKVIATPYKH